MVLSAAKGHAVSFFKDADKTLTYGRLDAVHQIFPSRFTDLWTLQTLLWQHPRAVESYCGWQPDLHHDFREGCLSCVQEHRATHI